MSSFNRRGFIMPNQALKPGPSGSRSLKVEPGIEQALDYPMREYIGGMSRELADMARRDGDEMLAVQLERASDRAALPVMTASTLPIQSAA